MNKILIVVDAQEDFVRGALRNEEAIKALPVLQEVVKYADSEEMHIFYTMDTHFSNYAETQEGRRLPVEHCIRFSDGWQICKEVASKKPLNVDIISKPTFGSMRWQFEDAFKTAKEVWICGFCTDICVSANFQIVKACFPEVPITIIEDACAGVTPELHKAALDVMRSCQADVKTWKELKEGKKDEA